MSLSSFERKHLNEIECHCASCKYGIITETYNVRCTHMNHPGYMGGCGTEWAMHCHSYVSNKNHTNREVTTIVTD